MDGLSGFARCVRWVAVFVAVGVLSGADRAWAQIIASDDASQTAYDDGWVAGDNGGSGFQAWSFVGRSNGTGFGGGFIASGGNVSIGTGGGNEAFGVYGNNGGVGAAIRPFTSAIGIGQRFTIDMDNQGIDNGGTVGFSLRNTGGNNLAEFYFIGGQSNYTVNGTGVSGTTPGFTTSGLRLSFTLGSASAFTMTIDQLSNGIGIDHTVTGSLLANADQAITNVRLFNSNGGPDVYFNSLVLATVPEASSIVFGSAVGCLSALCYGVREFRRRRLCKLTTAESATTSEVNG